MTTRTAISAMMLLATAAHAQDFEVHLDTKTSSATIDAGTVIDASGFLIGDYDPDANPTGTQTRAGLFGGSGNQPIDTITTLQTVTSLDAMPGGSMRVSLDTLAGVGSIDGFSIDLLNGNDASTDLSITIGFDTFRTVDPGFIYLGGIPITLPLGEVGQISNATLTQNAPAIISLTPIAEPGVFDIVGVIPSALDMTVSLMLPGGEPTQTPIEQLPVLVPISGQIELLGDGSMRMTLSAAPDAIVQEIPIEGVDLPAIPFELPTLGSDTAGVEFTLSPQSIAIDASITITINANGSPASCPADLTGDGNLDFFDVSAFLNAYGNMEPVADFDGNGEYDFFDVSAFLNAFTAGCP